METRDTETQLEYLVGLAEKVGGQKPSPENQQYLVYHLGRTGFHVSLVAPLNEPLRCEFVIECENSKREFLRLKEDRSAIESELGYSEEQVVWDKGDGQRRARIYVETPGQLQDSADRVRQFEWFAESYRRFKRVFGNRI